MNKIYFSLLLSLLWSTPIMCFNKYTKNGTYLYRDQGEYLQINKDSFRIVRTSFCTPCVDLDEGDFIAASGTVEYLQQEFARFTSVNDSSVYSVKVEENCDTTLKDSIKIKFIFPFDGKFRIKYSIADLPYSFTDKKCFTVSKAGEIFSSLIYDIYSQDLQYNGNFGEFFGRIAFFKFPYYSIIHSNTNYLIITIPKLTKSYFSRYFLDGEFIRLKKNSVFWRNREYVKVSDKIIVPSINAGEESFDTN